MLSTLRKPKKKMGKRTGAHFLVTRELASTTALNVNLLKTIQMLIGAD